MSLMIAVIHKHSVTYKFFFIIAIDSKCNLTTLINTVLLKVAVMLKNFFINIKFTALSFA